MQIQQGEPRLLDRVRAAVRMRHYSRRTEKAYVAWIRRFIVFHEKRHPGGMGAPEVTAFLSSLAARGVSASTQNQALSAILFLYGAVLGRQLDWMNDIVRAQRPVRLPVVLSREEVAALLSRLRGPLWLMASLMYGAGLRLMECAELRVKDVNFDRGELTIRDGKGGKDRVMMLPVAMKGRLVEHFTRVQAQHEADVTAGRGSVVLPGALRAKYPMRRMNGVGSGCFLPLGSTSMRRLASVDGITCTNPSCSGRSRRRRGRRGSPVQRRVTRCGTASRRICWKTATTFGPFRSCWGMGCRDDNDLHARAQSGRAWGAESARSAGAGSGALMDSLG